MADPDIQFGEIEQTEHGRHLRPDRNKHYAVVACGMPKEDDLPVFVDLDAMRDMEAHALSNTKVELGGVLLGGQCEDRDGKPFVMVTDSLRAEHYEASKGSFKFTHDTWSEITRQRDEFPDDFRMVGWYHTHPDWGVFLSGMDTFICDHFFNRPLDVALVVDPCRGDRGWFQWSGGAGERLRRINGFYLIASRHRQVELEIFAAQLKGEFTMSSDPRLGGYPGPGGLYPPSVVNVGNGRSSWQGVAVLGMLTLQFLFLALIAWKIISPGGSEPSEQDQKQVAVLVERLDRIAEAEERSREVESQLQILDRVVGQLGEGTPEGLVQLLTQLQDENNRLKTDALVYRGAEEETREELTNTLKEKEVEEKRLKRENDRLSEKISDHEAKADNYQQEIASLKEELESYKDQEGEEGEPATAGNRKLWMWGSLGLLLAAVIAIGIIMSFSRHESDDEFEEADEEDETDAEDAANESDAETNKEEPDYR
jgi:proteasome lid subunit RPN8/RPN11/tetrahydromethanopterin S-methyltransferase subunit B